MDLPSNIKKLDDSVVNRIAAGEIIQRPANALKELIENSLDAKSTNIQVTVKSGGLKLLQIQDNGTGIRKDNFDIVCERFTTSKLEKFEDLLSISTYGFRGEALASISHISLLKIISKTADEVCAYVAHYLDGKLQGPPKAIAGNQGTIITVEDLFYNMNARKKSLRSPAEEYQKITEVIGKYAIHNSKTGFSLKKYGENNDIRTPQNSNAVENIRIIYGNSIARELIEFSAEDDQLNFKATGYMTNVNYSSKKITFILFINGRLVDCQSMKRCIDQVYATYLPKNTHPFVYLSLEIDPTFVDVNVHPTKHEVHFLNEEQIVEAIVVALENKLLGSNNARVFYTQTKLPSIREQEPQKEKTTVQAKDLVRTDCNTQKLDKFLQTKLDTSLTEEQYKNEHEEFVKKGDEFEKRLLIKAKWTKSQTRLRSVLELRKEIEDECHKSLRETFAQHVFVGSIDPTRALIQHSTKLYLCDTRRLLECLLYQFVLYNFQNFGCFELSDEFSIRELALLGLNLPETGWTPEDGPKEELSNKIEEILKEKRELLADYFSLVIDDAGTLRSLPILLDNFTPDITNLPMYVVRLATEVDWDSEKECFETFAKETARFYANMSIDSKYLDKDWRWVVEHSVYTALKDYLIPPKEFAENGVVLEIANLPSLYKVFERC